jgi:hypothetical protein
VRSRRSIVYLVAGGTLCLASLAIVLVGSVTHVQQTLLAGIVVYMVSIPLLFQAKLASLDSRLKSLEEYLRKQACRESGTKYAGEEGEPPEA